MTVKGVLWRFALSYVGGLIAAGLILSYFGFEKNSGVNIGLLAACVVWPCAAFGEANRRYFTSGEKAAVVLGMLLIDLAVQCLSFLTLVARTDAAELGQAVAVSLAVIGILHGLTIYLFVGIGRRMLAKKGLLEE